MRVCGNTAEFEMLSTLVQAISYFDSDAKMRILRSSEKLAIARYESVQKRLALLCLILVVAFPAGVKQ